MFGVGRFFKHTAKACLLRLLNRNSLVFDTVYKFRELNTRLLDARLPGFTDMGVDPEAENGIVVSLTSFPDRMDEVQYTLYSLLTQRLKPRKVVLWLASEQFPAGEAGVPKAVLALKRNGLEIAWTSDIKAYKKLAPALERFPDTVIVTADDDIFYPRDWLALSYADYVNSGRTPQIYAHRVFRIRMGENGRISGYRDWDRSGVTAGEPSFLNFATWGAGVLCPPGVLHGDIFKKEIFMRLSPLADDVFYWAMAVLGGTKIKRIATSLDKLIMVNPGRESGDGGYTLFTGNVNKGGNDEQLASVIEHYPGIMRVLHNEANNAAHIDPAMRKG